MLVNAVFSGTGQPSKTIEAVAAGLPPVIRENAFRKCCCGEALDRRQERAQGA
jgi:hypothetical protein